MVKNENKDFKDLISRLTMTREKNSRIYINVCRTTPARQKHWFPALSSHRKRSVRQIFESPSQKKLGLLKVSKRPSFLPSDEAICDI